MNDSTTAADGEPYDFSNDPDHVTREEVQLHDPYLEVLLAMVHGRDDQVTNDGSFGLTVNIGGTVVSGLAITQGHWADLLLASVKEASAPVAEGLATYHELSSQAIKETRDRREEEGRPNRSRAYLHMKDVVVVAGSVSEPIRMPLWRGDIRSVTGWAAGKIG